MNSKNKFYVHSFPSQLSNLHKELSLGTLIPARQMRSLLKISRCTNCNPQCSFKDCVYIFYVVAFWCWILSLHILMKSFLLFFFALRRQTGGCVCIPNIIWIILFMLSNETSFFLDHKIENSDMCFFLFFLPSSNCKDTTLHLLCYLINFNVCHSCFLLN